MRRIAVALTFVASTTLLLVSTYTVATGTPQWGDVVAQSSTITREQVTITTPSGPEVVVRQAPPAPREDMRPPQPAPTQAWVPGRWEQPPERMATWVPGQWTQRGEDWVWRAGHWQ